MFAALRAELGIIMKHFFGIAALGLAAIMLPGVSNATTFVFEGNGGANDNPAGNFAKNCGSVGTDLCSINHALGFTYAKDGVSVTATAFANANPTLLIQDLAPDESGLGAFSENDTDNDQTQFNTSESIEFVFNQQVTLSNIEFNAGNDVDCSTPGPEGPCGFFDLFIDNVFFGNLEAVDLLAGGFLGTSFRFRPTTADAGFAIARFDVEAVPVPAALPLLLTGLAGLGLARRRKARQR
jgi:hypothetical protein